MSSGRVVAWAGSFPDASSAMAHPDLTYSTPGTILSSTYQVTALGAGVYSGDRARRCKIGIMSTRRTRSRFSSALRDIGGRRAQQPCRDSGEPFMVHTGSTTEALGSVFWRVLRHQLSLRAPLGIKRWESVPTTVWAGGIPVDALGRSALI